MRIDMATDLDYFVWDGTDSRAVAYRNEQEPSMRHFLLTVFLLLFVSANAHAQRGRGGSAAPIDGGPNGLGALHFRPLGPEGNRVASIAGVPGDPMTVYIGAADGGIWKTSDAGINWRPIFDDKDVTA